MKIWMHYSSSWANLFLCWIHKIIYNNKSVALCKTGNTSVIAMESPQSYAKPLKWYQYSRLLAMICCIFVLIIWIQNGIFPNYIHISFSRNPLNAACTTEDVSWCHNNNSAVGAMATARRFGGWTRRELHFVLQTCGCWRLVESAARYDQSDLDQPTGEHQVHVQGRPGTWVGVWGTAEPLVEYLNMWTWVECSHPWSKLRALDCHQSDIDPKWKGGINV